MTRINLLLLIFLLAFYGQGQAATDLGVVGKVYPIKERDALEELESKAKTVDWKKKMSKAKPEKYRPKDLVNVPRTKVNGSFLVDLTHELEMDIPDGKGGILYPKGFTFNPLDYFPFHKTMVIINADDKEQLKWFKTSPYAGRLGTMLLITSGSFVDTAAVVKQPAFYAVGRVLDRFQIKSVPSVVRQEGRFMRVDEVVPVEGEVKR